MTSLKALFISSFAFVLIACGFATAQAAGQAIPPSSGKTLCSALTPADFVKAGIAVNKLRDANTDGNDSAYCVYDSKAGKVEFDIFYPAGSTPDEIKATEETVLGEIGGKYEPVHIAGSDDAQMNAIGSGQDPTASITIRKGKAVFDINIPRSANAPQQLLSLTQIVLSRLKP